MRILFFILSLFALPLHAQEANPQIRVDTAACRYVTKHVPDADVAYKAGEDVHGKKVAPADLNSSPINKQLEDSIYLRLTNDTAKVFGLKLPEVAVKDAYGNTTYEPMVSPEMVVGFVTMKHGRVYLDDKPLESNAQNQLAVLCKRQQQQDR